MDSLASLKKELAGAAVSQDEELALDVLGRLESDSVDVSKVTVKASGIGALLGQLGKCTWSDHVSKKAGEVVGVWKKKLKSQSSTSAPTSIKPFAPAAPTPTKKEVASTTSPTPVRVSSPEVIRDITGVRQRDVIIAKLAGALKSVLAEAEDLGLTFQKLEQKAQDIEEALESELGNKALAKKTKFLQLVRNLRDESNAQLRLRVALGHLEPVDLVTMSAAELAPEEVRMQLQDLEAYNKEAQRSRKPTALLTTQFGACGKCKSTKICYFMMQTRSADEPMTVGREERREREESNTHIYPFLDFYLMHKLRK